MLAFAGPWLSQLEVERAGAGLDAFARSAPMPPAHRGGAEPAHAEPYLVAGSIALRLDQLGRAEGSFTKRLAGPRMTPMRRSSLA